MKKILKPALFVLVALAQLAIPLYTLYTISNIKKEAVEVELECRPVDPYNFMQGRYVILGFEEDRKSVKSLPSLKNYSESRLKKLEGKEVYCIVGGTNWKSMRYIKDIVEKKPRGHFLFIKAKVKRYRNKVSGERELLLDFSFNKYFLQEEYAVLAEKLLRQRGEKDYTPYLTISVSPEGETVVESLNVRLDSERNYKRVSIEEFIDSELKAGRLKRD